MNPERGPKIEEILKRAKAEHDRAIESLRTEPRQPSLGWPSVGSTFDKELSRDGRGAGGMLDSHRPDPSLRFVDADGIISIDKPNVVPDLSYGVFVRIVCIDAANFSEDELLAWLAKHSKKFSKLPSRPSIYVVSKARVSRHQRSALVAYGATYLRMDDQPGTAIEWVRARYPGISIHTGRAPAGLPPAARAPRPDPEPRTSVDSWDEQDAEAARSHARGVAHKTLLHE